MTELLAGRSLSDLTVDMGRLSALKRNAPTDLMSPGGLLRGLFVQPPRASGDGNLIFCETQVPAGERYYPPAKTHLIVVRHVPGPSGVVFVGADACPVDSGKGTVTVIPAGEPVYTYFSAPHRVLIASLSPKALYPFLSLAPGAPARVQPRAEIRDAVICSIASAIRDFVLSSIPASPAFMDAQASALAIHLLAHYCAKPGIAAGQGSARGIDTVRSYMRAHVERKLPIEELAEVAGCSPSHFSRLFKARTGMSPMRYLLKLRLEMARELIRNSSMSITEIGLCVGFENAAYFSRTFRAHWNIAPSGLRRQWLLAEPKRAGRIC